MSHLLRNEAGSALVLIGVSMFAMITAVGTAVDMARFQTLQARASSALDSGALAAGATVGYIPSDFTAPYSNCPSIVPTGATREAAWMQCQAQRYFNANIPVGFLGNNGFTINVSQNGSVITFSATGTQNTTFMNIVNVNKMTLNITSTVQLAQTNGLELVLALDNTGSMTTRLPGDNESKLQALKDSAGVFLNSIYNGANNDQVLYTDNVTPIVWVGMVPWTDMVNVGGASSGTQTVTDAAGVSYTYPTYSNSILPSSYLSTSTIPANWSGCIDARTVSYPTPYITQSSLIPLTTGSMTLTVPANLGYVPGQPVMASTSQGYISGTIDPATCQDPSKQQIVVDVLQAYGSGSASNWTIDNSYDYNVAPNTYDLSSLTPGTQAAFTTNGYYCINPSPVSFDQSIVGQATIVTATSPGYVIGTVASYSGTTLTINVTQVVGSGSSQNWSVTPLPPFYNNDACANGYGSGNGCTFNSSPGLSYDISLDLPSSSIPTFSPLLDGQPYNPIGGIGVYTTPEPVGSNCPQPILPMGSSQSSALTAINALTAQGNTMINIGLTWAWRMMNSSGATLWPVAGYSSTTYDGSWSGSNLSNVATTSFANYVKQGLIKEKKVIVLMTDGANSDPGVQCQDKTRDQYGNTSCGFPAGLGQTGQAWQIPNSYYQSTGDCCGGEFWRNGSACGANCVGANWTTTCSDSPTYSSGATCTQVQDGNCLNWLTCSTVCPPPGVYTPYGTCGFYECSPGGFLGSSGVYIPGGGNGQGFNFCSAYSAINANAYMDLSTPNNTPAAMMDYNVPGGTGHDGFENHGSSADRGTDSYSIAGYSGTWEGDRQTGLDINRFPGLAYMESYINGPTAVNNATTPRGGAPALDNATRNVCDAIKAQGIIIYTIGFGTADGLTVVDTKTPCNDTSCPTYVNGALLNYCATPGNYYLAQSSTQLTSVFQAISKQLNSLRLTK